MTTGERLRELRVAYDFSQASLAALTRSIDETRAIDQSHIGKIEGDKVRPDSYRLLSGLAPAFGVRVEDLAAYLAGSISIKEIQARAGAAKARFMADSRPDAADDKLIELEMGGGVERVPLRDLKVAYSTVRSLGGIDRAREMVRRAQTAEKPGGKKRLSASETRFAFSEIAREQGELSKELARIVERQAANARIIEELRAELNLEEPAGQEATAEGAALSTPTAAPSRD